MADSAGELAVRLLGPFEVAVGGRAVALPAGRLRALLAVLAMSAGRTVSLDRLATAVWGDDPPADPRRGIQLYVTRLRAALGAASIATEPAGYALRTAPDSVDALRFLRLLDMVDRVRLHEALRLWRGTPFDGVPAGWLTDTQRPRLVEHYLTALEQRVDLDLAGGRHQAVAEELGELVARHPLRESLWVRLVVALDRCGRRTEALARYETIRARLAEELGTDPGPELRQAHADLLAGRPVTTVGTARAAGAHAPAPRQLPPAIDGFTGRDTELKALNNLLDARTDRATGPVVISAIAGTAGVGKTTLAVHWAHQIADRFPDGQLYVNLRGFAPAGQALAPAEALRGFLDALAVPPHRIPTDLTTQTGLYRSLLAGRRMLVVLDNARDAEQVRPLLPGSPTCLVVVTSRSQLTSLVVTDTAHPVRLDLMPVDEARELLARRLGGDRIAAEPAAVDAIIASCARLPLTLAIAAARAAGRPGLPLEDLARQLQEAAPSLDAFAGGDPPTDVRAVFSWSYRALSPAAARLFRLIGLHPGPDLAIPAAASLAGVPVPEVRPLLAELSRAHLLTEHAPGRYTVHDLLRAYAAELAREHETGAEQSAALHRLLDHYRHTATAAARLLNPHRGPVAAPAPPPEWATEQLTNHDQAQAWFAAEHEVLMAAINHASEAGLYAHTGQLAWTVVDFLHRQARWHDWIATQQAALQAAQRLDDKPGEAYARRYLGIAYLYAGCREDGEHQLRRALDIYRQLGDPTGEAHVHGNLASELTDQGRHAEALHHSQRQFELHSSTGDRTGQAWALNGIGWSHAQLGDHGRALTHCEQALNLFIQDENPPGQAATWDSLGFAYRQLGQYERAVSSYRHAVDLYQSMGNRYLQSEPLVGLGDAHLAAGDPDAARTAWRAALAIMDELGHPDAERVRARLAGQPLPHRATLLE